MKTLEAFIIIGCVFIVFLFVGYLFIGMPAEEKARKECAALGGKLYTKPRYECAKPLNMKKPPEGGLQGTEAIKP